jgi:transcriptional regulator with XRE-family HTH domain
MTPKKKSLEDIFGEIPQSKWNADAAHLAKNVHWLRNSRKIALEIRECLDQKNMSQRALAEAVGVSPQIVNVWLKGKENFTLETISKLEKALDIVLINIERPSQKSKQQKALQGVSFHEEYDKPMEKASSKPTTVRKGKLIQLFDQEYSSYQV